MSGTWHQCNEGRQVDILASETYLAGCARNGAQQSGLRPLRGWMPPNAISQTTRTLLHAAGHKVIRLDLEAEEFDPCLKASETYSVAETLE